MKAVILAGGLGTRMGEFSQITPKCLLRLGTKTLLEHHLSILRNVGITDATVVIGEKGNCWTEEHKNAIRYLHPTVISDPLNETARNAHGLTLALETLVDDDILVLDGDLYVPESLLKPFVEKKGNVVIASTLRHEKQEGNRLPLDEQGAVREVSRTARDAHLLYGGLFKVTREDVPLMRSTLAKEKYLTSDTGFLLDELVRKTRFYPLVSEQWININRKEDVARLYSESVRNFVVLMYGYTAVGKSTTAQKLSQFENTEIFHSAVIRKELGLTPKTTAEADKVFDYRNNLREGMDRAVYGELAQRASRALSQGKNVVLDAGFFFSWQRQLIYDTIKKFNPDPFVIAVSCADESEIRRRLETRAQGFGASALNETPSWNTYLATKEITEPLTLDKQNNTFDVIEYDSHTRQIINRSENPFSLTLIDMMRS